MKNNLILILLILLGSLSRAFPQSPALVGYWHNWQDANAPYIPLDQVDSRYTIINIAFAVPQSGTDYKLEFIPDQLTPAALISQIQTVQAQGRKVIISVGGANAPVILHTAAERDTFEIRLLSILNYYGFDGIDIDFEGASLSVSGGTLYTPVDQPIINLITAIKLVMQNYQIIHHKKLYLSMAPETAFVQGGKSAYSGIWGAYLPVIQALRDSLDILHVQLYNSGSMIGPDGNTYSQGTADFIVAMTEMLIQGFGTSGGTFFGLPANKIAIGLPACSNAAGGGYADTSVVGSAVRYLRGVGPKPGIYSIIHAGGYPDLRGMMTWSVNWDATSNCSSPWEFASSYQSLFMNTTSIEEHQKNEGVSVYPNPCTDRIIIRAGRSCGLLENLAIYNIRGVCVFREESIGSEMQIDFSKFSAGFYYIRAGTECVRIVKAQSGVRLD